MKVGVVANAPAVFFQFGLMAIRCGWKQGHRGLFKIRIGPWLLAANGSGERKEQIPGRTVAAFKDGKLAGVFTARGSIFKPAAAEEELLVLLAAVREAV